MSGKLFERVKEFFYCVSVKEQSLSSYDLFSGIEPVPMSGHMTLNSTAACVHRRSNFYASIVGMGKNRRGLEIYGEFYDDI